ncbi:MAG: glycosyltransferase family 4 protein [Alphaproteobacteria bacterium]|nr:glycosyltransferase family 4 protein [Alphaproteobacteria bacterium]MBN2780316.1 glycosyltransferase family 4 protein [Alphaproteobacteria bacterium]
MKIGLLLPAVKQGGVESSVLDLALYLKSVKGVTPVVISNGGPKVSILRKAKVKHILFPAHTKNPIKIFFNISKLAKLLKQEKIDLLHVHSRAPAWVGYFATKKIGIPFLTTFHGRYGHKGLFGLKKKYNEIMLRGRYVIAVSEFTAKHIKSVYAWAKDKVVTVPGWIDLKRYTPKAVSSAEVVALQKKYALPKGVPVITIVGRLRRLKGHDYFLEALSHLKKDFRVLIIGSGDGGSYEQHLHNLVKYYDLVDKVIFVGESDQLPVFYALSSVAVSATSTKPETFGLTTLEAMAMGVPVVATAQGGSLELVFEGKTGFLVKPCDALDLARGLRKALGLNPSRYKDMQKACITFAKEFSRDKMCGKVLSLYRKLIKP